jgi:hypothetical protein
MKIWYKAGTPLGTKQSICKYSVASDFQTLSPSETNQVAHWDEEKKRH